MAQTLTETKIADCYHNLVFTTSDSSNSGLYRTDADSLLDKPITTLDGLKTLTFEVPATNTMFTLQNSGVDVFSVNGDGSIRLSNNSTLGTAAIGQIKVKNNELYIGV